MYNLRTLVGVICLLFSISALSSSVYVPEGSADGKIIESKVTKEMIYGLTLLILSDFKEIAFDNKVVKQTLVPAQSVVRVSDLANLGYEYLTKNYAVSCNAAIALKENEEGIILKSGQGVFVDHGELFWKKGEILFCE